MMSADAGTTHLEAVTVTGIYFLSVLIQYITVLECHAVLNDHLTDSSGLYLGEQIPTVIGIVCCDTSVKYVAVCYRQFSRKSIRILISRICIQIRSTVQHQVVGRPVFPVICALISADLKTGITIFVGHYFVHSVVASGYLNTLLRICGSRNIKSLEIPIIACQDYTCTSSLEIQYRACGSFRICDHVNLRICGSVNTSFYNDCLVQCISSAL